LDDHGQKVSEFYTKDQQAMIRDIFIGLS